MCSVRFSLVFEFFFLESFAESCFFSFWGGTRKKPTYVRKVWWTEGVGFGISSIASSSLGDRKKGYPKRQALWEKSDDDGNYHSSILILVKYDIKNEILIFIYKNI